MTRAQMHQPPHREGDRRKRQALANLSARRGPVVTQGRRVMLRLLLDGQPTVTADDVRESVHSVAGVDPRCFGAVPGELARAGIIRAAGYMRSTRPEAHARPVCVWELVDREAAQRWLRLHPEPAAEPLPGPSGMAGRQMPLFDLVAGGDR